MRRITTPGRQILANSGAQKGTAGRLSNAESCLRSYQKNITSDGNEVVKNPNKLDASEHLVQNL